MRRLTDGERDILAEQEADARDVGQCEPEDWYDEVGALDDPCWVMPAIQPDIEPDGEFPY